MGELNIASRKTMEKPGMHRTGEWSGRKNRGSEEERREYRYEVGGEVEDEGLMLLSVKMNRKCGFCVEKPWV